MKKKQKKNRKNEFRLVGPGLTKTTTTMLTTTTTSKELQYNWV